MKRIRLLLMIAWVFVLLVACREQVGGPCAYVDIAGACMVMLVGEPEADAANCSDDPVEVRFDFVPDDLSAREDYRFPGTPDERQFLTVAGGANPPRAWVEAEGLTQGSRHPCVRKEVTRGTCTPVLFEFGDIDYAAGAEQCYATQS